MEMFAHQIQLLVLRVFGLLLPAVCLAWALAVLKSRGIRPVDRIKKTFASMPPFGRALFGTLLVALVVYGSTKDGGDGTNEPPSRMSAPRRAVRPAQADAVVAEDIAHGWRVVSSAEAEVPVAMPEGAVTNDLLRRRGGFDWAFRVEPEGWRFPWRDGVLTGVTVLARGEVRPDVGTLYFPVPVTNGVSLLPAARWGLLPGGGASVFSHAATTNGSLILDWRNALVGRDITSPTNLQLELYGDGRFVWRTEGGSTSYRPVLPFDWDGDGLENAVDPEPLVADAADAHGTNAEWYRVVCSNVFEIADTSNIQTFPDSNIPEGVQFRSGVNTNAYYFVDVVAANGPTPIYFTADRVSRLGSPAIVARAGETNRVPLLVGVTYALTSSVPIHVELPTNGLAEVVSSCENACTLRWPLNFDFSEGTGRTYVASLSPHDPGGTFTWTSTSSSGSASLLSASADSSCSCWTGYGPLVTYSCSPTCGCSGGCLATGSFHLEGASFSVSLDGCRCGFDDPDPGDGNAQESGPEPTDRPSFSIDFSKSAVIFEDAYDDSPGVHKPKRSTRVRLTVSAYGGPNGGTFVLSHQNLDKLYAVLEGPVELPSSRTLAPYESFHTTCVYEAGSASDSEGDISVAGYYIESETGDRIDSSANLTVVEIELRTENEAPGNPNPNRHTYGIGEAVDCLQNPSTPQVTWSVSSSGSLSESAPVKFLCPISASFGGLTASMGAVVYKPNVKIIEPSGIECRRYGLLPADTLMGYGMALELYLYPYSVSFSGLQVKEVAAPSDATSPEWGSHSGYFADSAYQQRWYHYSTWGAGVWNPVHNGNRWGGFDQSRMFVWPAPWTSGSMTWEIPIAWKRKNQTSDEVFGRLGTVYESSWTMTPDSISKTKYNQVLILDNDGQIYLNGERMTGGRQ